MARALGESPATVHGWKRKGRIPAEKQPHVLQRGLALSLAITAENVVFPLGRSPDDVTTPAVPVACDRSGKTQCIASGDRSK